MQSNRPLTSAMSVVGQRNMQRVQKEMEGIYTTSIGQDTLDEAPMAYKSLSDILDVIGDTVEVIDVMKPVYNFKAAE